MAASTFKPPKVAKGRVSENEYELMLDEFLADTPAELVYPFNIQTYAAMRRDTSVAAIQSGYTLQLRRASWQLDGRGCDPALVQMVADDMDLPILGQNQHTAARTRGVSWSEHLRVALAQSLTFGHSGFALAADVSSGQARLSVLAERPPWTINEIHVDPTTGAFLGVTQEGYRHGDEPEIPAHEMAWYCLDREGANWAGVSMYRPIWVPWLIKREMIRVNATSNRRWGAGVPVMEAIPGTNPSPAEMEAAHRLASAARGGEQAGAATPPGFQMKIIGLAGAVPDTLGFLEWLNREISRAALMSHMELGQGSAGGSRALGTAFIDSWTLALETLGEAIADTATRHIAARLVEWNSGKDAPVPRVVVSGVGSRREVTAESLQALLISGALSADPKLEEWVRREYRLPEREPTPVVAPGATLPGQPGQPDAVQPGAVQPDGTPTPATASSTDDGLIAAVLAAANTRDWGALDQAATQLDTRETTAATAGNPAPQWAEIADDEGDDWKIDVALARGSDVASAYKSVHGTDNASALQRGYDVWAADQQAAGTPTAGTVDDFKTLVAGAAAPTLTLDLDNRVVAVAVRLGRFSASIGQPITTCPYKGTDAEQTALRRVWVASYLRLRAATEPAAAPGTTPAKPTMEPATTPAAAPVKASQRVAAAAGHPSACAHATLGSVCHCGCAGVRHGWLGNSPSGVKSLPDVNGDKAPRPGALDGLSGEKPPAAPAPTTQQPPTPAPAPPAEPPASEPEPEPEPAPAAPAEDTRSYNDRVDEALTEVEARTSPPLSRIREGARALTDDERDTVEEYLADGFLPINHMLRGGDAAALERWDRRDRGFDLNPEVIDGWTGTLDSLMAESPLPHPIVTYRGMRNGDTLFGEAFGDDLTGVEWSDAAYSSTSTDEAEAGAFALDEIGNPVPGSTVMHILVPSGVGALELSDHSYESEVLLSRGLRFRIVEDWGINPDTGVRYLDVEVIRDGS